MMSAAFSEFMRKVRGALLITQNMSDSFPEKQPLSIPVSLPVEIRFVILVDRLIGGRGISCVLFEAGLPRAHAVAGAEESFF